MKWLALTLLISSSFAQVDYSGLQWAHENRGEIIRLRRNFHQIDNKKSKAGFDTKLNEFANAQYRNKKDVVVAVIDSGVSFQHPDIQKNIYRNMKECDKDGNPLFLVNEDKDRNGYPGDCVGWNFASLNDREIRELLDSPRFQNFSDAQKDSLRDELMQARRLPYDIDGHGTHISGILAAERNNDTGLRGISDNIKILPIKVYDNPNVLSGRFINIVSGPITQQKPLATVITQGIEYAIRMNVDVINMSIGWNKITMSAQLERAINDALRRNIAIVTSSDNGGSNDSTFPCRLMNVICVGSTTPYGEISSMSNYGHNVDILAPGDKILSLYPMSLDPLDFSVKGYEYLSGTSQATAFISGAIALMKSIDSSMNLADIKRTLFNATTPVPHNKEVTPSLSGMIDYSKLVAQKDLQVVFPNFKRVQNFRYDTNSNSIQGVIALENLSRTDVKKKVKLKSLTPEYKLNIEKSMSLRALGIIDLPFEVKDINFSEAPDTIKLELSFDDKNYIVEYPLLYELDLNKVSKKSITEADSLLIRESAESKLRPILNFGEGNEEYYVVTIEPEVGLGITLFEESKDSLKSSHSLLLEKSNKISSVMKLDLNADGVKDYLIFSIHRIVNTQNPEQSETYWQYSYYDKNFKPLFGKRSQFRFVPTRATFPNEYQKSFEDLLFTLPRNPKDISFVTQEVEGLGKIALPVFYSAFSFVPVHQQQNSAFARLTTEPEDQMFYLKIEQKDGKDYLITYSLLDKDFTKELTGRNYKLTGMKVIGPLKDSSDCKRGTCTRFLVLSGDSYYKNVNLVTVSNNFETTIEKVEGEVWDLGKYSKREILTKDQGSFSRHDYVQVTHQDSLTQYSFANKKMNSVQTNIDQYSTYYPIASFESDDQALDLYFENFSLSMFDKLNNQWTTVPWKLYSFLDYSNQAILYESTFYKTNTGLKPAILWNAQALTEDSYRLAVFDNGEVFRPLSHAFRIPNGCQRLSNRLDTESNVFEIPLVCGQSGTKKLNFFTLPISQ